MNPSDPPPVPPRSSPSGRAIAGISGVLVVIGLIVVFVFLRSGTAKMKEAATDFQKNPAKTAAPKDSEKGAVKGASGSSVFAGDPDATLPPTWVPVYPAAQSQPGGRKQETKNAIAGTYLARTKDTPTKVTDYFESTLKADGFETDITTAEANGNETAVLTAAKDEEKRQVTVLANRVKGTTNLTISYQGPK